MNALKKQKKKIIVLKRPSASEEKQAPIFSLNFKGKTEVKPNKFDLFSKNLAESP